MIKIVEESRNRFNVVQFYASISKKFRLVGKLKFLFIQILVLASFASVHALSLEKVIPTSTTVSLYWTATGNDGSIGLATNYDIRYSHNPISELSFESAIQATNPPTPMPNGSAESFLVYGLQPETDYYFAIKVADETPNWSRLSNVVMRRTATPPICGDINESGAVDITDLVQFAMFVFIDNTPIYNLQTIDLDLSGDVDISDLIYLIDYIFGELRSVDCS